MGKIYYKVVALCVFVVMSFGFIAPFMISQRDDIMVAGGFAYIFLVTIPVIWVAIRNIVKDVRNKINTVQTN